MFQGLEHTAIASQDPEKLANWYVENLGFRLNYAYNGNFFVRAPNGSMLELIPSDSALTPQTPANYKNPGIRHLAIAVDDFEVAAQQLKEKNVHFLGDPVTLPGGNRLLFFNDGDGNILHLIKRVNPLP